MESQEKHKKVIPTKNVGQLPILKINK